MEPLNPTFERTLPHGTSGNPLSLSPQESGYPPTLAEPTPHLPPGAGAPAVPHILSFASVINLASRTYRWTVDEAQRHSEQNARACKVEPVIWEAIRARQYPVVQFPWHIQPDNEKDLRQEEAASVVGDCIKLTRRFQQLKRCHLDGTWYGRYATQMAYSFDFSRGKKMMIARDWWPVNGDKLHFKYDGRVGIRVHAAANVSTEPTDRGLVHFLDQSEREAFILHKFEPEDSDFFEPELAGAVHGTGIRGKIYWLWWLRSKVLSWMLSFLELVGAGGLTLAYYTAGSPESSAEVKAAVEQQLRNHVILFPRHANKETLGPGIERIEPSQAGANLIIALVTEYFDQVIRRLIIGPYMSSEVSPSGLGFGGGSGDLLVGPFARIVKYDAVDLADTYTFEWVAVLYRYLYPGMPHGIFEFDIDKPNAAEVAEATKVFYEMGGEIDEEWMRDTLGIPAPEPGHGVLAKAQPMSMVGGPGQAVPQGVPIQGAPGPVPSGATDSGETVEAVPGQPEGNLPLDPSGQPLQFSRLRRLSRKSRQDWWNHLSSGQKMMVMAAGATDLLTGKFRKARPSIVVNPTPVTVINTPAKNTFSPTIKPADLKNVHVTVEAGPVEVTNQISPEIKVDIPKVVESKQKVRRTADGLVDDTITTHIYKE